MQQDIKKEESVEERASKSFMPMLVVMYLAAFVAAFNENIINVALIDIMGEFSVSANTAQWLVTGYMIATSVLTACMAFFSGRFSTRGLLFFSCGCLVLGEALCFLAPSFSMLLVSRVLQAAGSGILYPLMMNVVLVFSPRSKLGVFMALGTACITLGPACSPVVSGLMVTLFGWRAIFVVPFVGSLVVLIVGSKLVRNVGKRLEVHLDIASALLLVVGLTAVVYSVGELSSDLVMGVISLVVGVAVLAGFVVRQLHLDQPLLNVRLMASSKFWPACLLLVVSMMTSFSMSVLLPLYFESAFGMTALLAGLLVLPAVVINAVAGIAGGRVMDARGGWPLIPVGFVLIFVGQLAISFVAETRDLTAVVLLTVLTFGGVGLTMAPSQTSGLGTLSSEKYSHGSALMNTWNMIAGAIGPSLFIGLMTNGASGAGAGVDAASAQAVGFGKAVFVAALIAAIGLAVSVVYTLRMRRPKKVAA